MTNEKISEIKGKMESYDDTLKGNLKMVREGKIHQLLDDVKSNLRLCEVTN